MEGSCTRSQNPPRIVVPDDDHDDDEDRMGKNLKWVQIDLIPNIIPIAYRVNVGNFMILINSYFDDVLRYY